MTRTRINMGYEVRYENGSSHFLPNDVKESLDQVIKMSNECLLGCLPKDFDPNNLVRPVIARSLGVCALCGEDKTKLTLIPLSIGHGCRLCSSCIGAVKNVD